MRTCEINFCTLRTTLLLRAKLLAVWDTNPVQYTTFVKILHQF